MSDMSSWYNDQGYPPCGIPPKKIQPLNNPASRPAGRAAWLPSESSGMPSGSGNMPPMGLMPDNIGNLPAGMGPMPSDMGSMPSSMGPIPSDMGPVPSNMGPAPQMPDKNMCFGEKLCRFPIGMGYVPMQKWSQPSPINEGFCRGTIFAELDLPFLMGRCI